ncbi:hypothetical protein CHARACLAT_033325 [Characodon lateralis]|uniref:Uncharacterized protein n=1 Tax=Characodon lateralis TaxID=208331 RepID=A0ABU7EI61_9TELE|nr:hypothetical protein [Characodon lateralis]
MPSRASSPPLAAPLLAALWLALGRCGASESPGPECDNGKLHLDRDLPSDAVYWGCPIATQPVFTQVTMDTADIPAIIYVIHYRCDPVR